MFTYNSTNVIPGETEAMPSYLDDLYVVKQTMETLLPRHLRLSLCTYQLRMIRFDNPVMMTKIVYGNNELFVSQTFYSRQLANLRFCVVIHLPSPWPN